MVINQMVSGRADDCSCTGHSTRRAQHPVLPIISPRIIRGRCIDLRGKTCFHDQMGWRAPLAR